MSAWCIAWNCAELPGSRGKWMNVGGEVGNEIAAFSVFSALEANINGASTSPQGACYAHFTDGEAKVQSD